MRSLVPSTAVIPALFLSLILNISVLACAREKSAADTVRPVREYFEALTDRDVVAPDLGSIEGVSGTILTWLATDPASGETFEYSWVLAKNTDDLKRALIAFDSARAWNTETYIFLPVSVPALEVHSDAGLMVPQAIYDEDGMVRIKEIVLSGEVPSGSLVDQFDQFYE